MTQNEYGIDGGTRSLSRNKDSLIGQEMTIVRVEKKEMTTPENNKRDVNIYTAQLHYEDIDTMIQFFGSSVMDCQINDGIIKIGDKVSIDKIVSKGSGRAYYAFVLISRSENKEKRDE